MDILEGLSRPIVADIGSGSNPFPLANLLIDLFPDDNRHRQNGEPLRRDGRRFIQANVESLPFPDQSIDFAWCRDVLEHCEHPDKAIAEIFRVAKHAFILCPTMGREYAGCSNDPKGWATHLWYVVKDGTRVKFFRKSTNPFHDREVHIGNSEYVLIEGHQEAKCEDSLQEARVLSGLTYATFS